MFLAGKMRRLGRLRQLFDRFNNRLRVDYDPQAERFAKFATLVGQIEALIEQMLPLDQAENSYRCLTADRFLQFQTTGPPLSPSNVL